MFIVHRAHCGRLWVVEVEGQVQVTLEAKLIDILTWNFNFLNPFLFYFLLELRNPLLFVHCGCYNQTLKYPSCGLTQKVWSASQMFQQFGLQGDLNLAFHFFQFSHWQPATVQCALCTINISQEMVIIPSFHHLTSFFHIISQKHDFLRF